MKLYKISVDPGGNRTIRQFRKVKLATLSRKWVTCEAKIRYKRYTDLSINRKIEKNNFNLLFPCKPKETFGTN